MKGKLTILSILFLATNSISQVDTLLWETGEIKEIREYHKYNECIVQAYHSNGLSNYIGHIHFSKGSEYNLSVESAFDKDGTETVVDGNGSLLCYDSSLRIHSISNFRNKVRFSDYKEFYTNGNIKIKGSYGGKDGVLTKCKQGIWQFFKVNNIITEERKYVNGNEYYWNYWVNGKQLLKNGYGELKMYYDSGILKSEGKVKDGKKSGIWSEYSPINNNKSILEYSGATENYINSISFKMNLVTSYDSNNDQIGKDGNGYISSYRNDGSLVSKVYYINNVIDSAFYYYENGNLYEKRSVANKQMQTNAAFYANGICAFSQVTSNVRKYWDWFGNLKEKIVRTWIEGNDDSYIETTTFYYPSGNQRKVSRCIVTTTFEPETGFIEAGYVCEETNWDESGKEINKP